MAKLALDDKFLELGNSYRAPDFAIYVDSHCEGGSTDGHDLGDDYESGAGPGPGAVLLANDTWSDAENEPVSDADTPLSTSTVAETIGDGALVAAEDQIDDLLPVFCVNNPGIDDALGRIEADCRGALPGDGDGSSRSGAHEDDDVFSDRSPMSSPDSAPITSASKTSGIEGVGASARLPRISDISDYERQVYVPAIRPSPRPPFRTPSEIRAMQMASPTPSIFSSPRSPRRTAAAMANPYPLSISSSSTRKSIATPRIGSQAISPMLSSRQTPSSVPHPLRKVSAHLVLLHVTVLPLRWGWGEVLMTSPYADGEAAAIRRLRDAWRQLQDSVGDTVLERGVLIPHPQNDYEVLEERLLEALDLPVRRRARILECGHYLGPGLVSDSSSECSDDDAESEYLNDANKEVLRKRHLECETCHGKVDYQPLGTERVYDVKVYASNGLMRAAAWAACWREMERVDIEIEPVVPMALLPELDQLAKAFACNASVLSSEEGTPEEGFESEHLRSDSPPHAIAPSSDYSFDAAEAAWAVRGRPISSEQNQQERLLRQQCQDERLREIYGHQPPPGSSARGSPEPPPAPCQQQRRPSYQTASLGDLMVAATKVILRDRRNSAIALLGLLVLALAVVRAGSTSGAAAPQQLRQTVVHAPAASAISVQTCTETVTLKEVVVLTETWGEMPTLLPELQEEEGVLRLASEATGL